MVQLRVFIVRQRNSTLNKTPRLQYNYGTLCESTETLPPINVTEKVKQFYANVVFTLSVGRASFCIESKILWI